MIAQHHTSCFKQTQIEIHRPAYIVTQADALCHPLGLSRTVDRTLTSPLFQRSLLFAANSSCLPPSPPLYQSATMVIAKTLATFLHNSSGHASFHPARMERVPGSAVLHGVATRAAASKINLVICAHVLLLQHDFTDDGVVFGGVRER